MGSRFLNLFEAESAKLETWVESQCMNPSGAPDDLRRDQSIKQALSQYKRNLSQLKRIKVSVAKACDDMQSMCETIRAVIAPITLCPPEILDTIFQHGLSFDRLGNPVESNAEFIHSVSCVSRRWRGVTLQRAQFWTCIPRWHDDFEARCVDLSKSKPLHIFTVVNDEDIFQPPSLALQRASHRWYSFIARSWSKRSRKDIRFLQGIKNLSTLKYLDVRHYSGASCAVMDFAKFRAEMANLTALTAVNYRVPHIEIISPHLTFLHLQNASSIETNTGWMALLAKCGNLETLILEHQRWYAQPLDVIPEIVLAKLHTLAVAGVCPAIRDTLLQCIIAPELKSATISCFTWGGDLTGSQQSRQFIRRFLQKSIMIERLSLSDDISEAALILSAPSVADIQPPSISPHATLPHLYELWILEGRRLPNGKAFQSVQNIIRTRASSMGINPNDVPLIPVLRKLVFAPRGGVDPEQRKWLSRWVDEFVVPTPGDSAYMIGGVVHLEDPDK